MMTASQVLCWVQTGGAIMIRWIILVYYASSQLSNHWKEEELATKSKIVSPFEVLQIFMIWALFHNKKQVLITCFFNVVTNGKYKLEEQRAGSSSWNRSVVVEGFVSGNLKLIKNIILFICGKT